MVQRSVFDNALTQRAARAGAEVRDGLALRHVEPEGADKVRVTAANGDTVTASAVLSARTARTGWWRVWPACAPSARLPSPWRPKYPTAGATATPPCVPKSPTWNTECGRATPGSSRKRSTYRWARGCSGGAAPRAGARPARANWRAGSPVTWRRWASRAAPEEIEFHGHPLPIWNGTEPLAAWGGRALLAGDAAGLVNPLFGDGISYACRSGALAGQVLAAGQSAGWTEAVRAHFAAGHDAALTLARFFYQFPGVCYKMGVKHPRGTRIAARLIGGDLAVRCRPRPGAVEGADGREARPSR